MARLRVYRGPDVGNRFARIESDRPDVVPFLPRVRSQFAAGSPLTRAKALHQNRLCRFCGHSGVDPVTLNDGVRDGSGQYVPGSATLVGFHCCRCHEEWPVYGE